MNRQPTSFLAELQQRKVIRVGAAYAVIAWGIAEVADLVLENFDAPSWIMQSLLVAMALGLPVALLLAWVFELTPEGIRREREIDRGSKTTSGVGRWLDFTLIALLSVALIYFVARHDWGGDAADVAVTGAKSIAVLPFENMSDSQENAFFASGVHEDVLTYLAKVADLRVISRTSVKQFAEGTRDVAAIAAELGVDNVVEGSVRRAGNRVRVTAQLIDARTEEHVWAESYDRDLSDVFEIQSAIAQEIVDALQATLSADERAAIENIPTRNIAAYDKYSQARAIRRGTTYSTESIARIEPLLLEAVALDPDFAVAYAMLGSIHTNFYWLALDRSDERLARARAAIDRAFELQPNLPEARAALAEYYYRGFNNYSRALKELQAAHAQFPNNSEILELMGILQRRLGRWDESIESLRAATQLDPGDVGKKHVLLETLVAANDWDAAAAYGDALMAKYAGEPWLRKHRAVIYYSGFGDVAATRAALADDGSVVLDPDYIFMALTLKLMDGNYEGALAQLADFGAFFRHFPQGPGGEAYVRSWIYDLMGDEAAERAAAAEAIELLEPVIDADEYDAASWLLLVAECHVQLGRPEEGIRMARQVLEMHPLSRDAFQAPEFRSRAARVLALAGNVDEALAVLEPLVDQPRGPTRWDLRLHPFWAFLRDDPRFVALVRES
jgi:TolB-like protein